MISEYSDRHFIHNILKTHMPSNVKFCDAIYQGTKEEKIASHESFESSALRVTTCIFSFKGESSSEVVVRLYGGRKMLGVHDPGRYRRYSEKKAYSNEEAKTLFKGELRMQTYTDIIKPSSLKGSLFLNICGGNKAHIVAHVSIMHLFLLEFRVCLLEKPKLKMEWGGPWVFIRGSGHKPFCDAIFHTILYTYIMKYCFLTPGFLQALGMKVVNIVSVDMLEAAKIRMISALD